MIKRTGNNLVLRHALGITLVETVLSMLILGGAFVASLNTITSARASQAVAADRRVGLVLAEDLMAEILAQNLYRENTTIFGPESDERGGDRANFDDIDDYNGWSSAPPTDVDGDPIAGVQRYTRQVAVNFAIVDSPTTATSSDTGLMKIVVTVKRGEKAVAQLIAYRSDVWQAPSEGY